MRIKRKRITSLLFILILIGCKSPEERKNQKFVDSVLQAQKVNIEKVKAEQKAYNNRPWKLGEFNNEFDEPTGKKYIKTQVDGTFSNSATSNSYSFAEILVTKSSIGIFLHEYSASSPAQRFMGKGILKMKNGNGKIFTVNLFQEWNHNGGMLIDNDWDKALKFRKFIAKSSGDIRVVVQDNYSSTYNFTISGDGFIKEFSQL